MALTDSFILVPEKEACSFFDPVQFFSVEVAKERHVYPSDEPPCYVWERFIRVTR